MKLTLKLAAAIFAGLSVVLIANVYIGIHLQTAANEEDAARDQKVIAGAVAAATESVWKVHGKDQALAVIETANQRDQRVHVRWVDLGASVGDPEGPFAPVSSEMLVEKGHVINIKTDPEGNRTIYSYGAISRDGQVRGAIEIAESLSDERRFISRLSAATAITGVAMILISAFIALVLGRRWVAIPIRRLMDFTQRVGRGDFSIQAHVDGTGEIAQLAQAMNGMSQNLERAMEQLRHADRLNTVGKLSSGVAHELGTPLHVALGRAKAICADAESPEHIRENAETIVRQADRMSSIIRQLLTFAHAKNLKKRTTNIIGIMREAVAMVRPMAHKRQVDILFPDPQDVPIVDVDPTQMQQVITNLLVNALHVSKPHTKIALGVERTSTLPFGNGRGDSADYVVCSIKDEGDGIVEESLPHIFEPFFTTKEVGEGTGLGLSVALGIVREHGGWIHVDTQVGAGSCFSIFLPAR
ncbi:sensor histidine kinase [Myxococcota bacterium]